MHAVHIRLCPASHKGPLRTHKRFTIPCRSDTEAHAAYQVNDPCTNKWAATSGLALLYRLQWLFGNHRSSLPLGDERPN